MVILTLTDKFRISSPEVFLIKGFLKICSKFTGEHQCQSVISIKLLSIKFLCNFIEITLWHRCSPVNLLHIFRTPFSKDTSGELLLVPALLRPIFLSYKSQSLYWHSKLLFLFCIISYLFNEKQPPQVFYKKVLLKILQNSQKNTCPRLSFLKKRPWHRCFPVNFAKFFRTPFLQYTSGLRLFNEHFCSKRQQQKVKDHSLFLSPHPKRS